MNIEKQIEKLHTKINEGRPKLAALDSYWSGEQPTAFLAPKSREALDNRLTRLSVNFPRLAVTSLQERLEVTGFRRNGSADADTDLWDVWRRNRMRDGSAQAHLDALVYGRSYALVWADAQGNPTITVESPLQVSTLHDPVTRRVTAALKRWVDEDNKPHAVLYGPEQIRHLSAGPRVMDLNTFPSTGWTVVETVNNPMGVVPMVPIVNRGRLLDSEGVSEMRDVLALTDALNKLMSDAMVTSEYFARPRRWVTGMEIQEDDEGNVIDPFSSESLRVWQSENPESKFGQFDGARLDGYADLTAVVTQQIGALTGLPPHYLGLHGDQPASADAIRSAEASLVSRAQELMRTFGTAWADVMSLAVAIRDKVDPLAVDIEPVWGNPETRTPAQAADAAAKLAGIGVPLSVVLSDALGYSPEQVARVQQALTGDKITRMIEDADPQASPLQDTPDTDSEKRTA